jgi:hypothetical protein
MNELGEGFLDVMSGFQKAALPQLKIVAILTIIELARLLWIIQNRVFNQPHGFKLGIYTWDYSFPFFNSNNHLKSQNHSAGLTILDYPDSILQSDHIDFVFEMVELPTDTHNF